MPIYLYQHPKTEKINEVYQSMEDEHIYIDPDGVKWNRVFTKPQASIDTQIDPHSSKDFVEKTRNKNATIGELWDRSAELSEKRAKTGGRDETKIKAQESYTRRTGKEHPSIRQERMKKVKSATLETLKNL
jgi:hypothetical protein